MSNFLNDTFTDSAGTLLESHTPDTGGAWFKSTVTGAGGATQITSGGTARPSSTTSAIYSNAAVPSGADYNVTGVLKLATARGGDQASVLGRYNPAADQGYILVAFVGSSWLLGYRSGSNTFTSLGSYTGTLPADGDTFVLSMSGNQIAAKINGVTRIGPVTDSHYSAAGSVGIQLLASGTPSDGTGAQFNSLTAAPPIATAFSLTGPTSAVVGLASIYTVAPDGVLTLDEAVTVTDDLANTIATLSFSSGSGASQTFSWTPVSGQAGSRTLTATPSPSLGTAPTLGVTVSVRTLVAPNNAAWLTSPVNWVVSSSLAVSTDFGAKRQVTFTNSTIATLAFDLSALTAAGVGTVSYPQIRYSLNGGASTDATVAAVVALATGLSTGTSYTLTYEFVRGDWTVDRYTTPVMALWEQALILDSGGTVSAPAGQPTDLSIAFGDSITEGLALLGASSISSVDATATWGKAMGAALNSQIGQMGKGGSGWAWAGTGNVPAFPSNWQNAWSGQSRAWPASAPKRLVVCHGTNDGLNSVSDATVTAAVTAWLTAVRALMVSLYGATTGNAVWIHVAIPFGGFKRFAIAAGIGAYKAAAPSDSRIGSPDLGAAFQVGLGSTIGTPTLKAPFDGVHLSTTYHGQAGAALAAAIQTIEMPPGRRRVW